MAPNETNKPAGGSPVPPRAVPPHPSPRRVDPRLWALLPVIALLILGAYSLGKYRTPEPPPAQPVIQAPPPGAPGKMTVTETAPPMLVTPVAPSVQPPATAQPPQQAPGPSFKQEEPAVVLPNATENPPTGDTGSDAAPPDSGQTPSGDDTRPAAAPDRDAVKINDPALEYPSSAYEEGVEGTARVTFTITPDGTTTDAVIGQSSGDSRLDQAAVDYVKRLRFRPAMRDGQPVPVQSTRSVPFSKR